MIYSQHIAAITALMVVCGTLALPAGAQEKTSVVGISLAQKDPESDFGQSLVPGTSAGTQVFLRVELPEKTLLKVDSEGTKVSLKDSTGATLDVEEDSNFGFFASISDDRHSVVLPIQSEALPASGATSIRIQGTIACSCGAEPKTEAVAVKLAVDEEVALGPIAATVTQVEEGFEPDTQRIELESKSSFDSLQSLVFLDAGGNEVESSESGSGSFGFGGDMTYSQSYQVNGSAARIRSAKITYFQQVESVKVPVDATVGLDLGPSR